MRPLKHGYTNRTLGDGAVVKKTYEGPDAELRLDRERTLLARLRGRPPVPPVHAADAGTLTLGFMTGAPGQELLDAGHAVEVLEACGKLLRRIHGVGVHDEGRVLGRITPGTVAFSTVSSAPMAGMRCRRGRSAGPPCWPDASPRGSSAIAGSRTVRVCRCGGSAPRRRRAGRSSPARAALGVCGCG
ncbi:phosphotransferase [Streptomyces sp. FXJ1.4098]|nr:phosphotransferase [Streptomyces sp. FXJ1.4098]